MRAVSPKSVAAISAGVPSASTMFGLATGFQSRSTSCNGAAADGGKERVTRIIGLRRHHGAEQYE
jgi:hypothetical protein